MLIGEPAGYALNDKNIGAFTRSTESNLGDLEVGKDEELHDLALVMNMIRVHDILNKQRRSCSCTEKKHTSRLLDR